MGDIEVQEWLKHAREDMTWARVSLEAGLTSRACFAFQQAGEKALKALLIAATGMYPRIHSLPDLLDLAVPHADLEELRLACQVLDRFYTVSRYPGADFGAVLDTAMAQKALEAGQLVLSTVEQWTGQQSRE